jgi:hypothetical protein
MLKRLITGEIIYENKSSIIWDESSSFAATVVFLIDPVY